MKKSGTEASMPNPPNNPLKRRNVAPIYKDTEKEPMPEQSSSTTTPEEESVQHPPTSQPDAILVQSSPEPEQPQVPTPTPQTYLPTPTQSFTSWQSPGQPSTHDRRSKVPFDLRHKKENFMIDKRILPYVYHWLENNGISKVNAVNLAWMRILIEDGYPVDPDILTKPFKWEDVPK
jgi:hypothetical protein